MFEPSATPRVLALPLGCDFSAAFLQGLNQRLSGQPPHIGARTEIFVNTRRTQRRLIELFQQGPAALLPRIRLITDLAQDPVLTADIPPPVSALRRRLEISQLVAALLKQQADLAPRSAIFDLADSLATLMDEMHGEGITPATLENLDVSGHSDHWKRSLKFLNILTQYFNASAPPNGEARQRLVVEHLAQKWAATPPDHPIIVAGSTGSRGATALFMRAVANLPQGAVVLPGFDFDQPASVWDSLQDPLISADHPQAGFHKLLTFMGLAPTDVRPWSTPIVTAANRNQLISLALRPAPVTDQWRSEGPKLPDISQATAGLSLLYAQSQRQEANAIALRLRKAAQDGQKATLISPDRTLTRLVSAALKRWNIDPDDSAGRPLPLTPPGIFLRLVAGLFGQKLTSETLLVLLKHPLTNSADGDRNTHNLRTRDLELQQLRRGLPYPDFDALHDWAAKRSSDPDAIPWVTWLRQTFEGLQGAETKSLADHLSAHRHLAESLAQGPDNALSSGELWLKAAGIEALKVFTELQTEADAAGDLSTAEYAALFHAVQTKAEVRESLTKHPHITIWGTLEARVQGADVVILGGLNDGTWPRIPAPDPWLNRAMRLQAGLLLPERNIGLSAHDFQQAVAGKDVLITRAIRDADAPTVASRWLIRLTNLLAGLGEKGDACLQDMLARGQVWADLANQLETPQNPVQAAPRPAPRPPITARPKKLSVTRIRTLIRDPYAIYAQNILRLHRLNPLKPEPDALLRGTLLHDVLHEFVGATLDALPETAAQDLLRIATDIFEAKAPWPAARRLWLARLARIAEQFMKQEAQRRIIAQPTKLEIKGQIELSEPAFTLTGTADRIDLDMNGHAHIIDYKSGAAPSQKQVKKFDKQLPLEAAMVEKGAFDGLSATPVAGLEYVSLAANPKGSVIHLDDDLIHETWEGLRDLIRAYGQQSLGYTARARMEKRTDISDYDHLSRRGEWDDSDPAEPQDVP